MDIEYINSIGTESYSVSVKHSRRLNGELLTTGANLPCYYPRTIRRVRRFIQAQRVKYVVGNSQWKFIMNAYATFY